MHLKKLYLICIGMISLAGMNAQTKYAKIVVYRNELSQDYSKENYKIYTNDVLTTDLRNFNFEEFYMQEGNFKLKVNEIYSSVYNVTCKAGLTYYFKINRDFSLPDKPILITRVDSIAAVKEMKNLRNNSTGHAKIRKLYRSNSVGLIFDVGLGLQSIPMMNTTNSDMVSISFGGGANFGLGYNYEFNDYFGMEFGISHQTSFLSMNITNASISFDRNNITFSPFITIPVTKRNSQRIKLGGGLDYYFTSQLDIDTEKLKNGFKDLWSYSNTFGYHFKTAYEFMPSTKFRVSTGLEYRVVDYKFYWGEKYGPTASNDLNSPNGSGLFFCIGFNYCF